MSSFVRTTGGLLQLVDKQLSPRDRAAVLQFAATLNHPRVREEAQRALASLKPQALGEARSLPVKVTLPHREPQDLQANPPGIFSNWPR